MSTLPIAGARAFASLARRTAIVRWTLGGLLVLLVLLAAAAVRHPGTRPAGSLPVRSGDMIVLDLSASISSDTFSRIGEALQRLAASNGRYGLVVFSNVAYEALPPGTPSAALRPLIRYFTLPPQAAPGAAPAYPTNPWSLSFSNGTRISAGLDLAHRILTEHGLERSSVVLISDLADDPEDVQQLNQIATTEYGRRRTRLRVIALNAAPDDAAYFARIADAAITQTPTPSTTTSRVASSPVGTVPLSLILAILAIAAALAAHVLWSARLRWAPFDERAA